MQCPFSYDAYYNKGIQPCKTSSALAFGKSIDSALNAILLGSNNPLSEYDKTMSEYQLGTIEPHKNDYDNELLVSEDKKELLKLLFDYGYTEEQIELIRTAVNKSDFSNPDLAVGVDIVIRRSLRAKAILFFEAYREQVLPYIEKVYSVQKPSGAGYLDAHVKWKGLGNVIIDHKTASKRYPNNAVEYSAQLTMYAANENVNKAVFVVFSKEINKNRIKFCSNSNCKHICDSRHRTCPKCGSEWINTINSKCDIQIVHGEITERMKEVAKELQTEVKRAVEMKIFPCNINICNNQYGKPCAYRDLKWKNSMEGLEVRKRRNSR